MREIRKRHGRRNRRSGVTLVELVTVITISGILLSILTALVVQVTRFEASTRERIAETMAIARLSDQFRDDVRRAANVELTSSDVGKMFGMEISLGDSVRIHYTQSRRGIDREMLRDTEVIARDQYRLPVRTRAEWTLQQVDTAQLAGLDLVLESSGRPLFQFVGEVGRYPGQLPTATTTSDAHRVPE